MTGAAGPAEVRTGGLKRLRLSSHRLYWKQRGGGLAEPDSGFESQPRRQDSLDCQETSLFLKPRVPWRP